MAGTDDIRSKQAKKADRFLRQVRAMIDPNVPTQVVHAFVAVWLNEGQTLSEIAEHLGTNVSTASRQLLDLGDRNRKLEEGYKLVQRTVDPMNLRVNRYTLTPKGKLLAKELEAILEDG